MPTPPLRPTLQPSTHLDVAEIQRLTPRVEIWRPTGQRPQVPGRHSRANMDAAFVSTDDPLMMRLQFDRRAAGKQVTVIGARGIALNPPNATVTVSPQGDCVVAVQLQQNVPRGHLIVICGMIRTTVPLVRAPLAIVQAEEERTGGRP